MTTGSFGLEGWFASMAKGIGGMTSTILIGLLAGGLMEVIRHNRGIQFIINSLTHHIHGKRGAEGVISALVAIINCVTANNTVAILAVGKISNEIADTYGVNKSKSASLLDTFSCVMQGAIALWCAAPPCGQLSQTQSCGDSSSHVLQLRLGCHCYSEHPLALSSQFS